MEKEKINLSRPKPFDEIGMEFIISGSIPKSWLKTGSGMMDSNPSLDLELYDINCKKFSVTSIRIKPIQWLSKFRKKLPFTGVFSFHPANISFIEASQGRIVIQVGEQTGSIFFAHCRKRFQAKGKNRPRNY